MTAWRLFPQIVLDLSTAYAMNRELATYLADFRGVEVLTVGVEFPGNKQRPMGKLPSSMVRQEERCRFLRRSDCSDQ